MATTLPRIAFVAIVLIFGASCSRSAPPKQCMQFSSDLMPAFTAGLNRKDFRMANAWAIKSDQTIDSAGVKFPAYFLSADIIAPNGEAVVGTWLTTDVTQGRLIYSLSPQAKKYTNWAEAGTASTPGIDMQTPGAKESISCVLNGRAATPQTAVTPNATTP
jgi:hypothetical protein